jgi:hypothetical protein
MLRAPDGRVMLLSSWWTALMRYAAEVFGGHHEAAQAIDWDPIIEEDTSDYKRFYAPGKFTIHEAYLPGDQITVRAVTPDAISLDDLRELLRIAGRYKGISPYRKDKQYGTFEVINVKLEREAANSPGSA